MPDILDWRKLTNDSRILTCCLLVLIDGTGVASKLLSSLERCVVQQQTERRLQPEHCTLYFGLQQRDSLNQPVCHLQIFSSAIERSVRLFLLIAWRKDIILGSHCQPPNKRIRYETGKPGNHQQSNYPAAARSECHLSQKGSG